MTMKKLSLFPFSMSGLSHVMMKRLSGCGVAAMVCVASAVAWGEGSTPAGRDVRVAAQTCVDGRNYKQICLYVVMPQDCVTLSYEMCPSSDKKSEALIRTSSIGNRQRYSPVWELDMLCCVAENQEVPETYSGILKLTTARRVKDAVRFEIAPEKTGKVMVGDEEVEICVSKKKTQEPGDDEGEVFDIGIKTPVPLFNLHFCAEGAVLQPVHLQSSWSNSRSDEYNYTYTIPARDNSVLVMDSFSDKEVKEIPLEISLRESAEQKCCLIDLPQPDILTPTGEENEKEAGYAWELRYMYPTKARVVSGGKVVSLSAENEQGESVKLSPYRNATSMGNGTGSIRIEFRLPKEWRKVTLTGEMSMELASPDEFCDYNISLDKPCSISVEGHTVQCRVIPCSDKEGIRKTPLNVLEDDTRIALLCKANKAVLKLHSPVELDTRSIKFYDGEKSLCVGCFSSCRVWKKQKGLFDPLLDAIFSSPVDDDQFDEGFSYFFFIPTDAPENVKMRLYSNAHPVPLPIRRTAEVQE